LHLQITTRWIVRRLDFRPTAWRSPNFGREVERFSSPACRLRGGAAGGYQAGLGAVDLPA